MIKMAARFIVIAWVVGAFMLAGLAFSHEILSKPGTYDLVVEITADTTYVPVDHVQRGMSYTILEEVLYRRHITPDTTYKWTRHDYDSLQVHPWGAEAVLDIIDSTYGHYEFTPWIDPHDSLEWSYPTCDKCGTRLCPGK